MRHKAFGPQGGTKQTSCDMQARTSLPSPTNMHEKRHVTFMCVVCLVQCSSDKKHASGALLFVHRVAGVSLASWSMQALPAGSSMPISQCLRGPTSVSSNPVSRLADFSPHRVRGVGGVPDCEATGSQGRAKLQ